MIHEIALRGVKLAGGAVGTFDYLVNSRLPTDLEAAYKSTGQLWKSRIPDYDRRYHHQATDFFSAWRRKRLGGALEWLHNDFVTSKCGDPRLGPLTKTAVTITMFAPVSLASAELYRRGMTEQAERLVGLMLAPVLAANPNDATTYIGGQGNVSDKLWG